MLSDHPLSALTDSRTHGVAISHTTDVAGGRVGYTEISDIVYISIVGLVKSVGCIVAFDVMRVCVKRFRSKRSKSKCNIQYNAKYTNYERNDEMTIYNDDDDSGNTVTTKLVC